MGKCRSCKYWWKGEKVHYSEDSVEWNGEPSPKAGTIELKRDWDKVPRAEFTGRCMDPNEFYSGLKSLVVTRNDDEILTRGDFGCGNWKHDDNKDKFSHTYVDNKGQQTLRDYMNEMKLQPEFEDPIDIRWNSARRIGWVLYPDQPELKLEAKADVKGK